MREGAQLLFVTQVHLGERVSSVSRGMMLGRTPGAAAEGGGELKVGDLTLIGGCREPLRGNRVLFPRGRMSVGDRDLVGEINP